VFSTVIIALPTPPINLFTKTQLDELTAEGLGDPLLALAASALLWRTSFREAENCILVPIWGRGFHPGTKRPVMPKKKYIVARNLKDFEDFSDEP
jgi:hypothetical protein